MNQTTLEQDLALSILRSVKDQSQWNNVLDKFSECYGVSGVSLMTLKQFDFQARNFFVSQIARQGEELQSLREIIEAQSDEDDQRAYEELISLPKGHVILETDAYQTDSVDDLPPSTFRSALLEKGFYQRGVSLLNGEGPWIDGLFYQLRTPQEASTLKTGKNLSWIFELMSAATENSRIENSIFNKIQSFTFILDRLTIGAFIVDADCRIIYQNNQSKLFQETGGSLSTSRSGKLIANDEATHTRMANIIHTSCDTNNKERAMLTASLRISLPNLSGDLPDVASFCPLFFGADDHGIETAASLVLVAGKGCEVDNASKSLGLVAGLTRAEMAVLDMLLESKNASEIAIERNVSAQTVKSQIKSIYSKLRCKSQPEVQRLASLFSLPMQ